MKTGKDFSDNFTHTVMEETNRRKLPEGGAPQRPEMRSWNAAKNDGLTRGQIPAARLIRQREH